MKVITEHMLRSVSAIEARVFLAFVETYGSLNSFYIKYDGRNAITAFTGVCMI